MSLNRKNLLKIKALNLIEEFVVEKDIELAGVQIGEGKTKMALVGVYHSPNGNWENFKGKLIPYLDVLQTDTVG